jgi:osmotically-inducible protein OsmY
MTRQLAVILVILGLTVPLSGCILAAAGAGVWAGTAAAQDRGVGGQATDLRIASDISDRWFREEASKMYHNLSLKVYNRRVLVMGFAPNPDIKSRAIELARTVKGVRAVFDEIQIGDSGSFSDTARDRWIETQLDSQLTFAENVRNMNYATHVINGTVYIIGIATDDRERQRVMWLVRRVSGVKKVLSFIEVRGNEGT